MRNDETWTVTDVPDQTGKRVLITGANSGIGYEAALVLARSGAQVVLACRDGTRGERALRSIRADCPAADIELAILDLASLDSVRAVAQHELARQAPLDLLINNAGVMAPPRRIVTAEGFELQFGTNVLGHFALTALLMPALERAAAAATERPRVVTISSVAHKGGRLAFEDLQSVRAYLPMAAYRQSKLACLMFAFALDRRLRAAQSRIMSVAAHPGVADTRIFRGGDRTGAEKAAREVIGRLVGLWFNSARAGALPTVYAATSPRVVDGGYYGPQGIGEMRGERVGPARIARQARDIGAGERLIRECEALTDVELGAGKSS